MQVAQSGRHRHKNWRTRRVIICNWVAIVGNFLPTVIPSFYNSNFPRIGFSGCQMHVDPFKLLHANPAIDQHH